MFQFRRFPTYTYLIQCTLRGYCPRGLPHSDISGSMDICSSPKLFAACHVLHRLLMPRHSPCALLSLTNRKQNRFCSRYCELCRPHRFFEIVIVTHHLNRCCSTIKFLRLLPYFRMEPLCCLTSLYCYIVQFSRCKASNFSLEVRSQSPIFS